MVRLAVIEDSEVLRAGLSAVLEAGGQVEVVGEFGLSESVVSQVERLRPDVVILGMRRPDLSRSAAICRLIRSASSVTRVLVLSPGAWEDEVMTSILSGASGHVSIDVPGYELVHAVRVAVDGGAHFEKRVADTVLNRLGQSGPPVEDSPNIEHLSARERTILFMLADGNNNREIAEGLGIATATVRNNLTRIRAKLSLDSRTKLARFVYEQGLTSFAAAGSALRGAAPDGNSQPTV